MSVEWERSSEGGPTLKNGAPLFRASQRASTTQQQQAEAALRPPARSRGRSDAGTDGRWVTIIYRRYKGDVRGEGRTSDMLTRT